MYDKSQEFMGASDAFSWHLEGTPAMRSTVVTVAWLARSPGWERLVQAVDAASQAVPRFRQRVALPPARLSMPLWVADADFDLSRHLRRLDAPAPRTSQAVLDLAGVEAMTPFDLTRPLWLFTLVEQMESDEAALIMKMHHSLTDGIGGIQLALRLFDQHPRTRRPIPTAAIPARRVSDSYVLKASGLHSWGQMIANGGRVLRWSVPTAGRTFLHPVSSISGLLATVRSVAETVAPVLETLSPVMTERGLGRRLEMISTPLDGLARASHFAGGTVNDAFLAAVTGGLRRYHACHGADVDQLRVAMPISIRTEQDPLASNRITLMRFLVPVGERDPAVRVQVVHDRSLKVSTAPSLALTDSIAAGLNMLPPGAVAGMLERVDLVASDVVGFPARVYLAGARVTAFVAFGPTMGTGVNFTLMSYDNTCYLGMTLDTAAVPDHEVFVRCMREGFDEVTRLGAPDRSGRARQHGRPKAKVTP